MKRVVRRSSTSNGSSLGAPCTWQRKPSSAYSGAKTMPGRASLRLSSTWATSLPIDDTMPMPVTTTRLIASMLPARNRPKALLLHDEEADAQILGLVDDLAVGLDPAIGHAKGD